MSRSFVSPYLWSHVQWLSPSLSLGVWLCEWRQEFWSQSTAPLAATCSIIKTFTYIQPCQLLNSHFMPQVTFLVCIQLFCCGLFSWSTCLLMALVLSAMALVLVSSALLPNPRGGFLQVESFLPYSATLFLPCLYFSLSLLCSPRVAQLLLGIVK